MPEHPEEHIGDRVRTVRKRRGLTQRELSRASGVSISLISKLEQGQLDHCRAETAHQLARALRVPTTRLLSGDRPAPDKETADRWAAVRSALDAPPDDLAEEPTAAGVAAALEAAEEPFGTVRLAELAVLLPPLLRDADALNGTDRETRLVKVRALQLAGWLLTQTHQYTAASDALDRALDAAADRLDATATVNTRCWLLLRQGVFEESRELAVRWADDIEPRWSRATPAELSAWGWMLIRVSGAAVRDNRPGEAAHALRLARSAAVAIGREDVAGADRLRTFGPATVTQHMVEHATVTRRPDSVLALAEGMPVVKLTASNQGRHHLNVADAHARLKQHGKAVKILHDLSQKRPEWLAQQRYARDIMGRVVGRRRSLTPEMQEVAEAVRLPL